MVVVDPKAGAGEAPNAGAGEAPKALVVDGVPKIPPGEGAGAPKSPEGAGEGLPKEDVPKALVVEGAGLPNSPPVAGAGLPKSPPVVEGAGDREGIVCVVFWPQETTMVVDGCWPQFICAARGARQSNAIQSG